MAQSEVYKMLLLKEHLLGAYPIPVFSRAWSRTAMLRGGSCDAFSLMEDGMGRGRAVTCAGTPRLWLEALGFQA